MKMIRIIILLASICLVGIGNSSCNDNENKQANAEITQTETVKTSPKLAQMRDAFSGKMVNRSIYADYKGKRIYFCCRESKNTFKKDPESYLAEFKKKCPMVQDQGEISIFY